MPSGWPWRGRPDPEYNKMVFETIKHMTTLSAGSILALVTFYEKLSHARVFTVLVGISLVCFIASIICGLLAQFGTIEQMDKDWMDRDAVDYNKGGFWTGVFLMASWAMFGAAMFCLCVYGLINLG